MKQSSDILFFRTVLLVPVPYLVTNQYGRYFHTVRASQTSFVYLTFKLQKAIEKIECHSSRLSCEQYGNSKLQEPYCPSAFGFRIVWLLSEFPYCSRLRRQEFYRLYIYPNLIIWAFFTIDPKKGDIKLKKIYEQNLRKKILEFFSENVFITML